MEQIHQRSFLLIISGPSGVGKGTILKYVEEKESDLWFSVSVTTRAPREGEIDGGHYHFITEEKYNEMVEQDAFLERADVHTARYGTPAKPIEEAIADHKIAILDIDTVGAANVRKKRSDAVSVFILPPSWAELRQRLTSRGTETSEQVEKRLRNARNEVERLSEYDYVITNYSSVESAKQLYAIIQAEKCRVLGSDYTVPEQNQ